MARRYSLRLASEQRLPKLASSIWWNLEVIVRPSIAADDDKSELGIVSIRGLSDRTWKTLVGGEAQEEEMPAQERHRER